MCLRTITDTTMIWQCWISEFQSLHMVGWRQLKVDNRLQSNKYCQDTQKKKSNLLLGTLIHTKALASFTNLESK